MSLLNKQNYLKVHKLLNFGKVTYMYIDHQSYYLDKILTSHKVPAKFDKDAVKQTEDLRFVTVTVKKEYEEELLKCFRELYDEMDLMGVPNYQDRVYNLIKNLV